MQRKSQEFPSVAQRPSSESAATTQGHVSKVLTHAKLPKLELKKFHGNLIHWYPFWESFESTFHKNPNLSSVDYLQSLLTGTAGSAIAGLALTSATRKRQLDYLNKDSEIDTHRSAH